MTWIPIKDFSKGLNKDTPPEELDLGVSTDGYNVRYRDGMAEKFRGTLAVYTTPSVIPYHIAMHQVGTARYAMQAGLQKSFVDDGTNAPVDITLANNTGGIDDRWCGFSFNGAWVQNNGVDIPQYWNGNTASKLANVPAWPVGYKLAFMRPFKSFLCGGDLTRGGVRERGTFLWSHRADPGTMPTSWDIADATKDAGDQPLAETDGTLIDCLPLGDMNIIYKDDAIHYQQEISSRLIFRFGRLPGDTGPLARGCVVNVPAAGHVYLSTGFDLLLHNGQGPQSVLTGRMRKWLRNNVNATYASRSFLAINPSTNEVLVCFPYSGSIVCNKALVWNWKDDTFAIRDLPNVTYGTTGQVNLPNSDTWATDTETWDQDGTIWGQNDYAPNAPRVLFAHTAPGLAMFDASGADLGAKFTARMECIGMHMGDPETVKLMKAVRPKFDATPGSVINVYFGSAMLPGQAVTWEASTTFTVGTDVEAYGFASGRFLALAFSSRDGLSWRIRSAEIDVEKQGRW